MKTLVFSEHASFYELLDHHVKAGSVALAFEGERPGQKSVLWKRLAKCKGWSEIEDELKNIQAGRNSPLAKVISPSFGLALTGGEIIALTFIATLIIGLLAYGIYKGRNVKLVTKRKPDGEVEVVIEIVDPNAPKTA